MKTFEEYITDSNKNNPCWKNYKMIGTKTKNGKTVPNCVKEEYSFKEWLEISEEKKPYKNFNPEKNHPEGGLKPSYAKKLGIHAGIETKREAEKKGGVDNMSEKTKHGVNHYVQECKA